MSDGIRERIRFWRLYAKTGGANLPGSDPDRARIWHRFIWQLGPATGGANVAGGLVVFVFLALVLPIDPDEGAEWNTTELNAIVFFVLMLASWLVGAFLTSRMAIRIGEWFVTARQPSAEERELTLRYPLRQLKVNAGLWLAAIIVFGGLNGAASPQLGILVAWGIALGALSTCALAYLLLERVMRPITAAALEDAVPERPVSPGVSTRVLLAWALGTGVPLIGALALAESILLGADISGEEAARAVIYLALTGLLIGLLAMKITASSVGEPVEEVRGAMRQVQAGDLESEVRVDDSSEVGLLQAGFNRMVAGLREREHLRDLFGRHVGEEVAMQAMERDVGLGGETRRAAAVFIDITGSTRLAADRPAPEVVDLLNRFFGTVYEVVRGGGGWVNKFEGDAALCVFGVPDERGDWASAALTAARRLRARLREEVPEIEVGIGVSAGEVVAGNVGAAERYEYTVIGDPVNEAARLSELAKERASVALASEAVFHEASLEEAARWSLGEGVTLRGRAEPTRLAEPAEVVTARAGG